MAATAHSPDDRQSALNSKLGAPITIGILLLIIILGYLTYRFRPKTTSANTTPPYRARRRKEEDMEDRYDTLEGMPVLQYDSKLQFGYQATKTERNTKSNITESRVENNVIGTDKKHQETTVHTRNFSTIAEILQTHSQASKNTNPSINIKEVSPHFSSQTEPQSPLPIQNPISTSKERANNISSEEELPACSICVSPFRTGENIRVLPCGNSHIYHPRCIDPWLLGFAWKCPLCRTALPIVHRVVRLPERAHLSV